MVGSLKPTKTHLKKVSTFSSYPHSIVSLTNWFSYSIQTINKVLKVGKYHFLKRKVVNHKIKTKINLTIELILNKMRQN